MDAVRDSRHVKANDRPNSAIMCLLSFDTVTLEQGLNGAVLVFALWLDPQPVVKSKGGGGGRRQELGSYSVWLHYGVATEHPS